MSPSTPALPPLPDRFAALFAGLPEEVVRHAVRARRRGGPPRNRQLPRFRVLGLLRALGRFGRWSVRGAWRAWRRYRPDLPEPSDSALSQARQRLGSAPRAYLVRHAVHWLADPLTQPGAFSYHLRWVAFDGTTLALPDTPANARVFGYAGNQQGASSFPPLRLLALCEWGTQALIRGLRKPFAPSEVRRADARVRYLEAEQLLLRAANFFSFRLGQAVRARGTHLRARVQAGPLLTPFRRLADGSYLAQSYPTTADRLHDRHGWRRVGFRQSYFFSKSPFHAGEILPGGAAIARVGCCSLRIPDLLVERGSVSCSRSSSSWAWRSWPACSS